MSRSTAFVVAFTLLSAAAAVLLPVLPQPLDYHDFADQRGAFGVHNFLDVVSDNESLFWDRLPMTIAFMGLVASQVVDRISVRTGLLLLGPMVLVGLTSIVYWIVTERRGAGNVLPYALLQGYAVIVLLMMAVLHPSRYTRGPDLYFIFGWYVLAKLLELFDAEVLAHSHLVSGHSLKHVAAAAAAFVACRMLTRQSLAELAGQPANASANGRRSG
jgi:hypothetical protein